MATLSGDSHIHFIGVGGVGMSGIALVALEHGMTVTGSDLKQSRMTDALGRAGIPVAIGHSADNLPAPVPDIVVISSAIPENNPELIAARAAGVEVWPRARMLAALGMGKKTLAVAGTHGKTTTSSMLATTLDRLDTKPTFLIGGTVDGYDTNAVAGTGEYFVVEADESDGSFTYLDPFVAIITNIEADHLDHYGTLEAIEDAFVDFMSSVPKEGAIVICGENPHVVEVAHRSERNVISYGFDEACDVVCSLDDSKVGMPAFDIAFPDGKTAHVELKSNPGRHNALNATAVMTALWFMGFDTAKAAGALSSFSGVRRRFDRVGSVDGIDIVDDYGHHPTEVRATIAAAAGLGYKRIHVLFQPHRYTRTESLARDFGSAFDLADQVTFLDVYSAGEAPIPGVSGKTLVDSVLSHNPRAAVAYLPHRMDVVPYLETKLRAGDLLLTMGAGDVTTIGPLVRDGLENDGKVS